VLLYEMLCGLPPFYDENVNIMYHKILYDPLRFPDDIDSKAKSLLIAVSVRSDNLADHSC
jgi:serum/glucocorticoid-regulated kinase 2